MQSNQCITCIHYQMGGECAAFPAGIPEVIFTGEFDHRQPYPGDHGIRWEPANEQAAELMEDEDA